MNNVTKDRWQAHLCLAEEFKTQYHDLLGRGNCGIEQTGRDTRVGSDVGSPRRDGASSAAV